MTTTAQQIQSIATVTASLAKSGHDHRIDLMPEGEIIYVSGRRYAGLDRLATVDTAGEIEWIR